MIRLQLNAISDLQQGAFFSSDTFTVSPTDTGPPEYLEPLSVDSLLERIIDMMGSDIEVMNESGRYAPPYGHCHFLTRL
jgi:furry protein family